jgi:hypothetical protein
MKDERNDWAKEEDRRREEKSKAKKRRMREVKRTINNLKRMKLWLDGNG